MTHASLEAAMKALEQIKGWFAKRALTTQPQEQETKG